MNSRALVEVLRDIIRSVERSADVGPDTPDLLELKRILLERIASLEMSASQQSGPSVTGDPPILPIDVSVGQALGLTAPGGPLAPSIEIGENQPPGPAVTADPPAPPIDIEVSQVLGLGATPDPVAPPAEIGDSQAMSLEETGNPPAPLPD